MAVAEKKSKAGAKLPSLGMQIDAIFKLREQLREIQDQEKAIQEKISAAEATLMETMDREGVAKSTGKLASVGISETTVGNVTDWDVFYAFVLKNKALHLLQRRVSDAAIREMFQIKGTVPGVEPFTKRKLSIRTLGPQ